MPEIAEIKVIDNEVWCKVKLELNTDVCVTISLYTPAEIEYIKRQAVLDFLAFQRDNYFEAKS